LPPPSSPSVSLRALGSPPDPSPRKIIGLSPSRSEKRHHPVTACASFFHTPFLRPPVLTPSSKLAKVGKI
jgi:hypothetical protein